MLAPCPFVDYLLSPSFRIIISFLQGNNQSNVCRQHRYSINGSCLFLSGETQGTNKAMGWHHPEAVPWRKSAHYERGGGPGWSGYPELRLTSAQPGKGEARIACLSQGCGKAKFDCKSKYETGPVLCAPLRSWRA